MSGIRQPDPRDPELNRGDGLRQMQQLGAATEVQEHAHLPGRRFLGHLEDKPAVGRMIAHDGREGRKRAFPVTFFC